MATGTADDHSGDLAEFGYKQELDRSIGKCASFAAGVTTVTNALGVKLMSRINSTGVFIELIAAVLLTILLAANITRGPDVLFETQGRGEGHDWGYFGAFLAAALASAYVMYGFDTASSLGEETMEPRRTAPPAIMRAVVASFVIGGLILLFAIMSVSDIGAAEISTGGLQYGAVLFIGVVFFGGLAYYWFVQRHETGVLASHAAAGPPAVEQPPEAEPTPA